MIRTPQVALLGLLALITVLATAALIGQAPASSHGDESGETVRIIARLQADGDIEFGLRTSEGNQLPRQRVFSASISDDNWRRSSIVELSDGTEIRIIARTEGETRVEFGLRIDEPLQEFLPPRRFFPRSATVGRWLQSSQILLPAPEADEQQEERSEPTAEPESTPTPEEEGTPPPEESDEGTDDGSDEADTTERISGGHRDGLAVVDGVLGNPDAPVLISEYGDPF